MRLNYALCCFYCVLNCISAFNFFPKYAQVFSDNNPGSYFGYSVLLQAAGTNSPARVVIGSPRSNSTYKQLQSIPEPGAVYSCSIIDGGCKQFLFDLNANIQQRTLTGQQYSHKKDNGWLGAAIDGQNVANGRLVACSPRWINQIHSDLYYLQNGLCYLLEESVNVQRTAKTLLPLINQANQGYRTNESVYYYALGEAGMSVHFAKDTSELLFGAPGVLQWKGMIGKYHGNQFKTLTVPNPHHVPRLQDFAYFGYSVSSGRFDKSSNETWYVGGAPRGRNLFGQVLLYDYGNKQNELKIFYEMSGQQEGEYFGAAVAVGDINGDGVDDVIVGSPMYASANHYDVGSVYVYINKLDTKQRNFERTIINPPTPTNGIRFGTAVSVIGDVNHDGYADVAVGAPYYNNGQGAIFIYLGSHTGITEQYSQRILASEVSNNLRGFGASFSRGVDIDNNNYNDLAVGSFLSSHAVVLKTRPVVTIHPVLKSKRTQISTDVKSFQISACVKYTGAYLPTTLNVRISIVADDFYKRVSFSDNRGTMWEVVKENRYAYNQEACDEFDVLVVNNHSDFTQPIIFKMTYELIEPADNGFCATCPVVDKRLSNYTTLSIHYETGCGTVCRPDLKLTAQFKYHKEYLVIGEEEKIDVAVNISNIGEPSYATKFYAEIPTLSNFVKIPDMCQHVSDNILLCDMGNLMKKSDMKSLLLPLDVSMLGNNDQLVVKLNVTSSGEEVEPSDNIVILNITLKTEVRISVIGIPNPEQFNFIENEQLKQDNLTFTHQYTVQNLGPSPLPDLELTFWIPQSFGSEETNVVQVYKPDVQADGTTLICRTSSPQGFYVDPGTAPDIIEADDPTASGSTSRTSRPKRQSPRSDIPPPEEANETNSAEELNLPMDNPEIYTRVQKLIASDRELPEGLQENRTLALGCGADKEMHCMEVTCTSGVLKKNSRAVINFKMVANLTILDEKRGEKDTIVITSSVQPTSKYFTVNKTYTHTLLQGNVRQESPWKWIILGLILGIILLFVIIYALYRAGFFRRTEHEKLMNEKDETLGEELTEQTD